MKRIALGMAPILLAALLLGGCSKNSPTAPSTLQTLGKVSFAIDASGDPAANIVSGKITINKGNLVQTQSVTVANHTGTVTFANVQIGKWDITAQLFDADGTEIYSGQGKANVAKDQTAIAKIKVNHNTGNLQIIVETPEAATGLVFWNKLGSADEIVNSMVGPNGVVQGGSFTSDDGLFGKNAYEAGPNDDYLVGFPLHDIWPYERGCVEFWARLKNYPEYLGGDAAGNAVFLNFEGPSDQWEMKLASNDGVGGGGLCTMPGRYALDTQWYGPVTYNTVLGDQNAWHHYALVWNKSGLSITVHQVQLSVDPPEGIGTCEIFIDGRQNGGFFRNLSVGGYTPPLGQVLRLVKNSKDSSCSMQISNLKVWNYDKTDFSDRFTQ